jgi:hypothetical protein
MTDERLAERRKALLRIVQQTESEPMSEGLADGTIVPNCKHHSAVSGGPFEHGPSNTL